MAQYKHFKCLQQTSCVIEALLQPRKLSFVMRFHAGANSVGMSNRRVIVWDGALRYEEKLQYGGWTFFIYFNKFNIFLSLKSPNDPFMFQQMVYIVCSSGTKVALERKESVNISEKKKSAKSHLASLRSHFSFSVRQ